MSPDAIASMSSIDALGAAPPFLQTNPVAASNGFSNMVSQGLDHVNQQLKVSQTDLQQLAIGDVENLHQVMIRLEETKIAFQLMLQVRSRFLEAYQDVMKMQV